MKKRYRIGIACIATLALVYSIIYGCVIDKKIKYLSTQDTNYQFNEEIFKQKYNSALQLIDAGITIPQMQESDLEKADFVALTLEKEVYGLAYFVLLPIEKRGLTGKEMLTLADKMREFPIEQILQNNYSKKEKFQNRHYTFEERILEKKLMSEYFYLGKMPKEESHYTLKKNGVLAFGAKDEFDVPIYWIYPNSKLNEEQMLQVIDKKYRNMDKRLFTPSDKEISYEECINIAKDTIEKFKIPAKNMENYYPLYNRGSLTEDYRGVWQIIVETGERKYVQLEMDALEGKLNRWILLENDTPKKTIVSKTEAKIIAEEYVKQIIAKEDEIVEIESKRNQQSILETTRYNFKIRTKNDIIIEVGIRNNEQAIAEVTIQ